MSFFWQTVPTNYRPSYAGSAGDYSAAQSSFNKNATNSYWINRGLDRVAGGLGNFNIGVVADSLSTGYNGATEDRTKSWPYQLANQLALLGFPRGGDGVCPLTDPLLIPFVTGSTGVWNFTFATAYGSSGAGTFTFVTSLPCTTIEVISANNGTAFSYTIDAGGAINVVPDTTLSYNHSVNNGLANAIHTVVLTTAAANTFAYAICADRRNDLGFVTVNILSMGGSQVVPGNGNYSNNWNDTSGFYYNLPGRLNFLPTTMDMWLVELGMSDIENHGNTVAQVIAGYTQLFAKLRAHSPNSNIVVVNTITFPNLQFTVGPAWMSALFALCQQQNIQILDWNDRLGGYANALAMGMLGADNTHFNYGTQAGFGRTDAQSMVQ